MALATPIRPPLALNRQFVKSEARSRRLISPALSIFALAEFGEDSFPAPPFGDMNATGARWRSRSTSRLPHRDI